MDYKIVKRVRTNFVDSTASAVDGYRVHFVMGDGTPDYVEIPLAQYGKDNVTSAIEEAIARHKEVVG